VPPCSGTIGRTSRANGDGCTPPCPPVRGCGRVRPIRPNRRGIPPRDYTRGRNRNVGIGQCPCPTLGCLPSRPGWRCCFVLACPRAWKSEACSSEAGKEPSGREKRTHIFTLFPLEPTKAANVCGRRAAFCFTNSVSACPERLFTSTSTMPLYRLNFHPLSWVRRYSATG